MSAHRIGVVGLGPMGGAIARALVAGGHEVTVWNRTAEVAGRLHGATPAGSVAALVAATDAVVVSLPSYRITQELLDTDDCAAALDGRLLIQLSTGRPDQARQQQAWAQSHGAAFLAGSVLGYPRSLGTEAMSILYGGARSAFDEWAGTLADLAPGQLLVGEDPGAPAALSGPLWHFYYGAYGAFLEAAAYADASGVGIRDFARAAEGMSRILSDGMRDSTARIAEDRLGGDQATIAAIHRDLVGGQSALDRLGIDGLFRAAFVTYLGRAIDHGDEDRDPAAAFHHVRHDPAARA
jgi:3-hydroxyisobutyrate dehydrogenase-like beta-hydroxyacid dehydrogenase